MKGLYFKVQTRKRVGIAQKFVVSMAVLMRQCGLDFSFRASARHSGPLTLGFTCASGFHYSAWPIPPKEKLQ